MGRAWSELCLALALTLCACIGGVHAEPRRVALVVGNGGYPDAPLKNPANDARAVAKSLATLGFQVEAFTDLNQKDMNRAITRFGERLGADTVALFYYAGHGMQVRGKNYLIPVDARITSEGSIRSEAVDVDALLDQFQAAGSGLNIVILDACRNNPFERRFRGTGGGLAQMDAPKGTLIAYATAPGHVAMDGEGDNGLYTTELLAAMATASLRVEDVFKRVRVRVAAATSDQQMPWEASSLTGDFYFAADVAFAAQPSTLGPAAASATVSATGAARGLALQGLVSVDKEEFLGDPRVVARLKALGVDVRFQALASRDAAAKAVAGQHDFAFVTSAALAAQVARRLDARRVFTPFYTPVVVASWQPVATMLADNEAIRRGADGVLVLDMRKLTGWMADGRRWKSLRGSGRSASTMPLLIRSADPRQSATAAAYLALVAFIANGEDEIDKDQEVNRVLGRIKPLFSRQGAQSASSVDTLNEYLEMGIGTVPLALVDESQYVNRLVAERPAGEPVLLYPQPGIFVRHAWVALSEAGEHVGRLFREDAELQRLAGEHGFRTGRDAEVVKRWRGRGVAAPESFVEMANLPTFEFLEKLVAGLGSGR
jgi:uncharacterized caspase-like protein